ncbi:hypothetical protein GF324_04045 [bacterium]|nr:hypothetical protein [bacterium]
MQIQGAQMQAQTQMNVHAPGKPADTSGYKMQNAKTTTKKVDFFENKSMLEYKSFGARIAAEFGVNNPQINRMG